ncbi:MAG TPA: hypothetical protein VM409_03955 [Chloroflexia bacterium]|nr:hypothetical protein [Chloroflexia bacterium]
MKAKTELRDNAGPAIPGTSGAPGHTRDIKVLLFQAAWMAIMLGIVIQVLLALVRLANFSGFEAITEQLLAKVAWSFVVCVGLAVGLGVSQGNPPATGLAGMLAAPLAFNIARGLHKGTAELLGTGDAAGDADPFISAVLRGTQYLLLGLLVAWLSGRQASGLLQHVGLGLLLGLVFGGAILLLTPGATLSPLALISWGINELLFPIGCSIVLFVSDTLAKRLPT